MGAEVRVLGPYPPKQFDKADTAYVGGELSTSATLNERMTADVANLYQLAGSASDVVSVEPVVVLGNVYLIAYIKA